MQTWFFALKTDPLTPEQIDALEAGAEFSPRSLSAYGDGSIVAAVDAETITAAFRAARDRVCEVAGARPRVIGLHGELADSVADVVFQGAERVRGEADPHPLPRHVADLWTHEAWDMAALGAREEECFTGVLEGRPRRVPSTVVRPIEVKDPEHPDYTIEELWAKIWHAAKAYLAGEEDEYLAWIEERRARRASNTGNE